MDIPVLRRSGQGFVGERALNISYAGLAIATRELLLPGSPVELVIPAPDGACEVPVMARVSTIEQVAGGADASSELPYRAGLKITHIDPGLVPTFESLFLRLLTIPDGKRARRRIELSAETSWQGRPDEPALALRLRNMSVSGALVVGPEVPQKDFQGELSLVCAEDGKMQLVSAQVVWTRSGDPEDWAGLKFTGDAGQRAFLARVLRSFLFLPRRVKTPPDSRPIARVGQFEIEEFIARGGMCDVYRGRAVEGPLSGKQVALKRLRPELASEPGAVERFTTEADLGRLLKHPGVVHAHTALNFGGEHWIAMEYVDGRSLADILMVYTRAGVRPPIRSLMSIGEELLTILEHCHGFSSLSGRPIEVVHGDVTPSNVLLTEEGAVRLTDFGAASTKVSELGEQPAFATKLSYLAPELYLSGPPATPLVDVFQVAVLLYESATGVMPFKAQDPNEMCKAIKRGPIAPSRMNPEVTRALEKLILQGLSYEPRKRPQGARAFCDALYATGECPSALEAASARSVFYLWASDGGGRP